MKNLNYTRSSKGKTYLAQGNHKVEIKIMQKIPKSSQWTDPKIELVVTSFCCQTFEDLNWQLLSFSLMRCPSAREEREAIFESFETCWQKWMRRRNFCFWGERGNFCCQQDKLLHKSLLKGCFKILQLVFD